MRELRRAAEYFDELAQASRDAFDKLEQNPDDRAASTALGKAALPKLLKCLTTDDPEVKIAVALAVRRLGKDAASAGPALVKLLADPNERVQGAAATALSKVPCDAAKAVPLLVPVLGSRDSNARYNAMGALRKLGPKSVALGIEAIVPVREEFEIALPPLEGGRVLRIHCHLHQAHRSASLVVLPGR